MNRHDLVLLEYLEFLCFLEYLLSLEYHHGLEFLAYPAYPAHQYDLERLLILEFRHDPAHPEFLVRLFVLALL